jgi:coproporphyrinogen III oxidase
MSLGNTTISQQKLEDIYMSHMERPESVQAFTYKGKTYPTFKEACQEEFYDKVKEVLTKNGGGSYLDYSKDAFKASIEEIRELTEDYHNFVSSQDHPTIQAGTYSASDLGW